MLVVLEVSWRLGQTATYWPKVVLTIAALLSHLGWGWSTVGHWGPKALCLPLALNSASGSNCNWNWPKLSVAPGYIIFSRPPASAVPLLIYTGVSLDWWLSWGSIYNVYMSVIYGSFSLFLELYLFKKIIF